MIRTFGGPSFNAMRDQLAKELKPAIPGIEIFMQELEQLFNQEWADTEYDRMFWDTATGLGAVVVAGGIVLFPVAAPVLVPIELTLMGTQLVVEGGRLIGAYQDYAAAETLLEAGAGDVSALTHYEDVLNARTSTFVLVTGMNVVGAAGSVSALNNANRILNQADNAAPALGSAARGADDTQIFRGGTFEGGMPTCNVDADDFLNMTAQGRAAALEGLSDTAQARFDVPALQGRPGGRGNRHGLPGDRPRHSQKSRGGALSPARGQ